MRPSVTAAPRNDAPITAQRCPSRDWGGAPGADAVAASRRREMSPALRGRRRASLALAPPGRAATRVPRVLHFIAVLRMQPGR